MSKHHTLLELENVRYFSQGDEDAFFAWLESIESVVEFHGRLRTLYVSIDMKKLTQNEFLEILALFHRYKIPKKQLLKLEKPEFSEWLRYSGAFWYRSMFK